MLLSIHGGILTIGIAVFALVVVAAVSAYIDYKRGLEPKPETAAINNQTRVIARSFDQLTRRTGTVPDDVREIFSQLTGKTHPSSVSNQVLSDANQWLVKAQEAGFQFEVLKENYYADQLYHRTLSGNFFYPEEKAAVPVVMELGFSQNIKGEVIREYTLVFSTEDCGESCRTEVTTILPKLFKGTATVIPPKVIDPQQGSLYLLTEERGDFYARNTKFPVTHDTVIAQTYGPLHIEMRGQKKITDVITAVELTKLLLQEGSSVLVTGGFGTGKSSLVKKIASQLPSDCRAYLVDRTTLSALVGAQGKAFLLNEAAKAASNNGGKPVQIVLIFDEAHKMTAQESSEITSILGLTDGIEGAALKISVLLSVNSESVLDPALTRANRFKAVITVNKLDRAHAENAFKFIAASNETQVLDEEAKKQTLSNEQVSLAEIYQCFSSEAVSKAAMAFTAIEPIKLD